MFNVGGGELLVIFLVALIVLGPAKLPEVARQVGGVVRELRRISSGFQDEMRAAMEDPVEAAARERGNRVVATSESPAPTTGLGDELDDEEDDGHGRGSGGPDRPEDDLDDDPDRGAATASPETADDPAADSGPGPAPISTAAAAGMYDVAPVPPTSTPNPYLAPVGTRAQPLDHDDTEATGDPDRDHPLGVSYEADPADEAVDEAAGVDDAEAPDGIADERR